MACTYGTSPDVGVWLVFDGDLKSAVKREVRIEFRVIASWNRGLCAAV